MIPSFFRVYVPVVLLSACCISVLAQTPVSADPYRDEPYVFETLDTTVRMKPDGTGERLTHVILRVQSEGTARQFSVLSVSYASANETGEIDSVRVHKADGSIVETPTADAMEMSSEVTREAPMYSDIRERHLPVRSLSVGDKLEYQLRVTRTKAEAPNAWWGAEHFATNAGVILSETITLQAPAGMYLQIWSPNHPVTPKEANGQKTWTWTYTQTKPSAKDENGRMTAAVVKDADEDGEGRKLPSLAWTTFHSWAEVGDWYRGLALPRANPTDAIQAKAAELTRDAKTPEEQVRALYRYVAMQTRYVSISLGVGRYQPHAATEVLSNQYGDCKDKDTLLESLLKAKGFTTAPALIGTGIVPVPEVPTPSVFNHVITTVMLPGAKERIWLDSTAEVAPYRILMPILRDQNALVVPSAGAAALQKTPANSPFPYQESAQFIGQIDAAGSLKGEERISYHSDSELVWRAILRQAAPAQWDQMVTYMGAAMGFPGNVSGVDLRQSDAPDSPFHLSFQYTQKPFSDWSGGRIVGLLPLLDMPAVNKEKEPEWDIDLGAPRTLIAHSTISLPPGYMAEPPNAIHVQRPYATFDETWKAADGKLQVDRTVAVLQHTLRKAEWKDYLDFYKASSMEDGERYVDLVWPHPMEAAHEAADTATKEKSADQLGIEIQNDEKRNDWKSVRLAAEELIRRFPNVRTTHSWMGFVEEHEKHDDKAVEEYRKEVAAFPDNTYPDRRIAAIDVRQKKYDDAIAVLRASSGAHTLDIQMQLVGILSMADRMEEALAVARESAAARPENKTVQTEIAQLLQRMQRKDDAAAAAKAALADNNDPNLINSNAYFLAELHSDLPFAEESSRRSIEMFERMNSTGAVEEANARSFSLSAEMVASWDTLGEILLLEGKPRAAEAYLSAAWFNMPDVVKGNHLAQAYEDLGRKSEARRIDALALQAEKASAAKEDFQAVNEREERLQKLGVAHADGSVNLKTMRTFHVKRPAGLSGSAIVRVQMAGAGIVQSTLVSGSQSLAPLLPELEHLDVPPAVPGTSPAHVLRDAALYCSDSGTTCDLVFMLLSGPGVETGSGVE